MTKKNNQPITRRPPRPRYKPPKLEDQVLALTAVAAKAQLPMRVEGQYGLDVVVRELGGPQEFVKYCRLSNNQKIQNMVRMWDQAPGDQRERFSFQALCEMTFIDALDVLTDVVSNLYHYHGSMARIVNALSVKEVMETSARVAKTDEGFDDRKLQLDIAGLLPKRGPLVNVNVGDRPQGVENLIEEMDNNTIDVSPENK